MDTRTLVGVGLGAALGAGICYWCMKAQRDTMVTDSMHRKQAEQLHEGALANGVQHSAGRPPPSPPQHAVNGIHKSPSVRQFQQDDVLREQLTRNVQFFGAEGQQRIADAFVIVVGLGGVGSHAAHMLLRSGVGKLRIIDFDLVTLSSLNRHAVATRADVGTPKAVALKKHFMEIMPEAEVEVCVEMYTQETEERLLSGNPTFVFDAIDNIDTKVALIVACKKRGLKVLSSAGAGAKADPTRMHVVDVGESAVDPLARAVRLRLRKDHGITSGIPVLLSTEKPRCKLVASEEVLNAADPREYQIIPNFRVTTIPVLGTTPSVFGQAAAGWILCQIANAPFQTEPIMALQDKQYEEQLILLREREMTRLGDSCPPLPIDMDDVIYLIRELWRACSAKEYGYPPKYPGKELGLKRATSHLCLTRWDKNKPAYVDNLVLLTHDEADEHDAADLETIKTQQPEYYQRVERVLTRARNEHYY